MRSWYSRRLRVSVAACTAGRAGRYPSSSFHTKPRCDRGTPRQLSCRSAAKSTSSDTDSKASNFRSRYASADSESGSSASSSPSSGTVEAVAAEEEELLAVARMAAASGEEGADEDLLGLVGAEEYADVVLTFLEPPPLLKSLGPVYEARCVGACCASC